MVQATKSRSGAIDVAVAAAQGSPDVNAFLAGVQTAGTVGTGLTQRIVLKRTGDLSQAVSFEWYIRDANFDERMYTATLDQVTSGTWDAAANEQKGVVSWAAGDGSEKTLYFTPRSDDIAQDDYNFNLMVRADPGAPTAIARIDEFGFWDPRTNQLKEVLNQQVGSPTPSTPLSLAQFSVLFDEGRTWISNSVSRNYNPETSLYDRRYTPDLVKTMDEDTATLRLGSPETESKIGKPWVVQRCRSRQDAQGQRRAPACRHRSRADFSARAGSKFNISPALPLTR